MIGPSSSIVILEIIILEINMLHYNDIRNHYTVTVINKFDTFQETSERLTLNDKYENFVTAHIKAIAEWIPRVKYKVLSVSKRN